MNKKAITIISIIIISIISIICLYNYIIEKQAEKDRCIIILVNEDEIEKGCEKYFLHDK